MNVSCLLTAYRLWEGNIGRLVGIDTEKGMFLLESCILRGFTRAAGVYDYGEAGLVTRKVE